MNVQEAERPSCLYSRYEGQKLMEWPENYPIPTQATLGILKKEHDQTQDLYRGFQSKQAKHWGYVLFCGERVHSFVIASSRWDVLNGWNKGNNHGN